ncbi:hypothetical protein C5167_048924 [Papaver somniferum]|uniref:Major facilitator superfamily (MFS) profile domain-containing protein n=1 Tax=Papaver somniferum TaxID=3469 RepID=A0A4Y7KKR4_PAPSO|nr:protein NRT1/ PTR FAMILY 5.10-like [Papaver somniferum]RZC73447.1 hypothetical protein C5167_048924 [Papaver somniferum]
MEVLSYVKVDANDSEVPLLTNNNTTNGHGVEKNTSSSSSDFVEGVVDYKGEKVFDRSKFGGWKSASFLILLSAADSFVNVGMILNLISYLTGPLQQPTLTAAKNINILAGVTWMVPLFTSLFVDCFLGQLRTILFSCLIYITGFGFLTLSVLHPYLKQSDCVNKTLCNSPSSFQILFFYISLYIASVGGSGFRLCAQAFGADQFDETSSDECKSKSSFFNWWYFAASIGTILSQLILNYIQDNLSWVIAFGISGIVMIVALAVFLLRMHTYRYNVKKNNTHAILDIIQVYVVAAKNWRSKPSMDHEQAIGTAHPTPSGSHQFRFLDKALIDFTNNPVVSRKSCIACSFSQVEDAKVLLQLVPIWITCLIYVVVSSQSMTFFTKQSITLDRSIGPNFQIPAASIYILVTLSIAFFVPIYDRLFIPLARVVTGNPNGITTLQRIGAGIFFSTTSMVVAAIIEKKRLQAALNFGLIDDPNATIPMSVLWLVPQYVLTGFESVFTFIGLQEFFYDQSPKGLKSVGLSLFYSMCGIGSFLSGILITIIERVTCGDGSYGWFANNLNQAHLDYFYWLLAGLSTLQLIIFIYFSNSYRYRRGT